MTMKTYLEVIQGDCNIVELILDVTKIFWVKIKCKCDMLLYTKVLIPKVDY